MENELTEKQPRLWLAILCAIGFGLIGAALYIFLYYIGVIAWIAAFAIAMLASFGYKKFNLKMDTKGYIIVAVVTIVEVLLSLFVGLAIDCTEVFEVSFGEGFGLVFELINDYPVFKSAVIQDAIFSLIGAVVGIVLFVSTERRRARMLAHEAELTKQAEANETTTESNSDKVEMPESEYKVNDTERVSEAGSFAEISHEENRNENIEEDDSDDEDDTDDDSDDDDEISGAEMDR